MPVSARRYMCAHVGVSVHSERERADDGSEKNRGQAGNNGLSMHVYVL